IHRADNLVAGNLGQKVAIRLPADTRRIAHVRSVGVARIDAKDALHILDGTNPPPQLCCELWVLGAEVLRPWRSSLFAAGFPAQHQFVDEVVFGHLGAAGCSVTPRITRITRITTDKKRTDRFPVSV